MTDSIHSWRNFPGSGHEECRLKQRGEHLPGYRGRLLSENPVIVSSQRGGDQFRRTVTRAAKNLQRAACAGGVRRMSRSDGWPIRMNENERKEEHPCAIFAHAYI